MLSQSLIGRYGESKRLGLDEPGESVWPVNSGRVGVVMTVITVLAVITGIPRFRRNEQGRTKE
jgi:hypothetical protein